MKRVTFREMLIRDGTMMRLQRYSDRAYDAHWNLTFAVEALVAMRQRSGRTYFKKDDCFNGVATIQYHYKGVGSTWNSSPTRRSDDQVAT